MKAFYAILGTVLVGFGITVLRVNRHLARRQAEEHARGNRTFNPYFPLVGPRPWAGPVFIVAGVVFLIAALLE